MRVALEAEKRVDVDGERSTVDAEEFDDGDHEVMDVVSEVASRGKARICLVNVGV